jgi:DNA/RNA-binding domain of Phe-tRNA-synthetase-like protein
MNLRSLLCKMPGMQELPFRVHVELPGWDLFWSLLESRPSTAKAPFSGVAAGISARIRQEIKLDALSSHPALSALRKLFRAAGCDPTRYRTSSEALLRRILKGEELPAVNPLVDLGNCLSAALASPCCVMAESALSPPFLFRAGKPGESYVSLRGPLSLEGKPLLLDEQGPCDTPISGNERVKVTAESRRIWLVVYLPAGVVSAEHCERQLIDLLKAVPIADMLLSGHAAR